MLNNLTEYALHYLAINGVDMIKKTLLATLVFFIILIFTKNIIAKVKKRIEYNNIHTNTEYSKKLSGLIGKILFIVGMIFNILIIFEIIGIDVALLMAGISLGIGFAMETTISNVVAGFFILTNKKVKIGDYIQILGTFNTKGTIEEINMKHTIVRTIDMRRLLIPNMTMASTPIKTIKTESLVKGEIEISLPRHINIKQIKNLLNKTINENGNILNKNYTNTYIRGFDDKGYKFNTVFFLNPNNGSPFVVGSSIRKKLSQVFKKYGITFPYEHIVINIEE